MHDSGKSCGRFFGKLEIRMFRAQTASHIYDVCSATGHSSPGYLPKDCPVDEHGCTAVASWQHYTRCNPASESIHNGEVLAQIFGFSNRQNFAQAYCNNPDYQAVVTRYECDGRVIWSGYRDQCVAAAPGIKDRAEGRRLKNLAPLYKVSSAY